jgi:hypothetical protein
MLLALIAILAPSSATALPVRSLTTAEKIDILVGPVTPVGGPGDDKAFTQSELRLGRTFAAAFPANPKSNIDSNYYDLALALYHIYYRSGDEYWLKRARVVASAWRDDYAQTALQMKLSGDHSAGNAVPPPRAMATLGLAVLALEAGDARAAEVVHNHARLVEYMWPTAKDMSLPFADQRESGYALMALIGSILLGNDHVPTARAMVDVVLARQQPDGRWQTNYGCAPNEPYILNYMTGILMEALILYDEVVGDARIAPAIQRAVDWTWQTQWVKRTGSFQYANVGYCGVHTGSGPNYAALNGLLVPAWGYLYEKTRDVKYRRQGEQMLEGLVYGTPPPHVKMFTQMFRSSGRFLGFVARTMSAPPSSSPGTVAR